MALVEGAKFGRDVVISGNRVAIDGKHISSINELISLNRSSRERYGLATDRGESHLLCSREDPSRITDICITKDEVRVNGISAKSVEDLKTMMRSADAYYEERAGHGFLNWLISR
jgi:hypothetical protein